MPVGLKTLAPYLACSDIISLGYEGALQFRGELSVSGSPAAFAAMGVVWDPVFSVVFGWWREVIKMFCLSRLSFSRWSRLLLGLFCLCSLAFPGCWLPQLQVWDIYLRPKNKTKPQELTTVLLLGCWGP